MRWQRRLHCNRDPSQRQEDKTTIQVRTAYCWHQLGNPEIQVVQEGDLQRLSAKGVSNKKEQQVVPDGGSGRRQDFLVGLAGHSHPMRFEDDATQTLN